MKKTFISLLCLIGLLVIAENQYTVVTMKLGGLPMSTGKFSVYCEGIYLGNCEQSYWHRENTFNKNNILIGITEKNNKIVIHRADKTWDEFNINLDGIPMDGKHHKIKGSRVFEPRRTYEYEIEIVAEPVKFFTLDSFHAPAQYIKNTYGDVFTFSEPVFYVEVCSGEKVLVRTKNQPFRGNKVDFNLDNKIFCLPEIFPIIIRAYVGEKKAVEAALRASVGGGGGAIVGGIIGGVAAGLCTGGLGAPEGAIIGAAIGAAVGGSASYVVAPVKGAREIASFRFNDFDSVNTQTKAISGEILLDGQELRLVIRDRSNQ